MNNSKKGNKFLVILGAIILGIFISVSMINMAGNGEYNYSTNVVKRIDYTDGKMIVTMRDDMIAVCAKQTKTEPTVNSLCWIDAKDSKASLSIYEYKTYYIWTKDSNNVISYYNKYNTQNN